MKLQGNATPDKVLKGSTFLSTNSKELQTGTMNDNGAVSKTLNAGGSYAIPKGYHNGSGKVSANSLASQTDGSAVAGDIKKGKTAWVKGNKITGTYAEPVPKCLFYCLKDSDGDIDINLTGYKGCSIVLESWTDGNYIDFGISKIAGTCDVETVVYDEDYILNRNMTRAIYIVKNASANCKIRITTGGRFIYYGGVIGF